MLCPELFWAKVNKTDSCWLWLGNLNHNGYGSCYFDGKTSRANRVAWFLKTGRYPHKGLVLDHLCRTRLCVNVDHLEEVTVKENIRRGIGFAAKNMCKTHCPNGHVYNKKNTYRPPKRPTERHCKLCGLQRYREYYRAGRRKDPNRARKAGNVK